MNKSNFFKKILIWDLICFLFLIAIDRVSKYLAMHYCEQKNITLIDNALEITYLENYGGALGILSNQRFFFIFISALFITLIIFFLFALPNDKKFNGFNICLSFIIAGMTGNMLDRIIYGYVVDIIYIAKINFPVFNLSDIWISIGVLFTIVIVLFRLKEKDFEFMNFKQNKYREIK